MLGYLAAKRVVERGRKAFFSDLAPDSPTGRTIEQAADDQTPQFGYVGDGYGSIRILLLGINPGNGPKGRRISGDIRMMPFLRRFADEPTEENFAAASRAYKKECRTWPIWKRHCSEILGSGKLSLDDVAYANCLPWRTESQASFSDEVADRTARLYVAPLLEELRPQLIVALGKTRVVPILKSCGVTLPAVIVWNRSQAATATARAERAASAQMIFQALAPDRNNCTGADLVEAMQACPDPDFDFEPART